MFFIIQREDLLKGLQHIVSVIEKKQTLPILSNVFMETGDNAVYLTGSDLEIQIRMKIPAQIKEPGKITVSARKYMDICRHLPEFSEISCQLRDGKFLIRSLRSRFRLSTLDPDSFPEFSRNEYDTEIHLSMKNLRYLLGKTSFCMALQDVRYFLNGVMLEISSGEIRSVASDGHRLALCSREEMKNDEGVSRQIIIPRKGVNELTRLLGEDVSSAVLKIGDTNLELTTANVQFLTKLIDGNYPDFSEVFSQNMSRKVLFTTREIKDALGRVLVLSHEKIRGISLHFSSDMLKIRSNNSEQEEAVEEIDIAFDGPDFSVDLNCTYLLDAVNNIDSEKVRISFAEPTNACFVEDPEDAALVFIVMPLRV